MENNIQILYCGSYTEIVDGNFGGHGEGIYCFQFNTVNGNLQLLHTQKEINPSYLCIVNKELQYINNSEAPILFTITELLASKNPSLQSYSINKNNYTLNLINSQVIEGGCPCHVAYINNDISNKLIAVSCYETGNVILYNLDKKVLLDPLTIQHKGHSQHPTRQSSAHAHCVYFDHALNKILVADLGLDEVRVYTIQQENSISTAVLHQIINLPAGSGPRHICFDTKFKHGFIINELTGSVTIIKNNGIKNNIENADSYDIIGTFPMLEPSTLHCDYGGAAIRVSDNGNYIYTSIRSDNTIRLYTFDKVNSTIKHIDTYKTLGTTPRDFIIDPTGKWLLITHQDSDTITIFSINPNNGTLRFFNIVENIKSPVSLAWLII